MIRKLTLVLLALLIPVAPAWANSDLSFVSGLTQSGFKSLSRELGSALSYKNVAPAEALGITGFDIAAEVTAIDISRDAAYWQAATGSKAPAMYYIPKLRVRKGLPFGIDVGAMYAGVPDSNIHLLGAEVSKSLIEGGLVAPDIGLRATYTNLLNIKELDLQTVGLDASISKEFVFITPYAGAGAVWIDAKAKGRLVTDPAFVAVNGGVPLKSESFWQERFFGGVRISPLPIFNITGEVEYSGRVTYTLRAAFGW
jgi:hypothetical protein